MMALVNTANVGLVVLPTHRLLKNLTRFAPADFLSRLRRYFDVRPYPGRTRAVRTALLDTMQNHQNEGRHAFGLCLSDGNHYILLLRNARAMDNVADHSSPWRRLDVAILHHLILETILEITQEQIEQQACVEYVQDFPHTIAAAAQHVQSGRCHALLLLNPTRIDDVLAVVRNNDRLPQKSTFFYPKVYTGLVFNCLGNSLDL